MVENNSNDQYGNDSVAQRMYGPLNPRKGNPDAECEVVTIANVESRTLYDFQQKLVASPAERGGEGFIKFAVTTGHKGAKSAPHFHPRDEVAMTIKGRAVLRASGKEYIMEEGMAVRIPPRLEHSVEVLSDEWIVVAAYCDECSMCQPGGVAYSSDDSQSS